MENQKDKEAFNKDRGSFIALYWGQEVLVNSSTGETLHVDQSKVLEHKSWSLLLKSLENISNEDANHCGFGSIKTAQLRLLSGDFIPNLYLDSSDYLRSKGYLLPFRQYSTEEILSMGWARYE